MVANDLPGTGEEPDAIHDALADRRVNLERLEFFPGKRTWLQKNGISDSDFADIVKKRGMGELRQVGGRNLHYRCKVESIGANPERVSISFRFAGLESCYEGFERRTVTVAKEMLSQFKLSGTFAKPGGERLLFKTTAAAEQEFLVGLADRMPERVESEWF